MNEGTLRKETSLDEINKDIDNVNLVKPNNNKLYLFTKRLMDIIGSIAGLILLFPIFILIAITIKVEDPKGPILFKQVRVGTNKKEFTMYKFRSMVTNAEEKLHELLVLNEVEGAMFKMKEDPRVTKTGKFIRKTSIDELPQLWNVLKGDMSLVGPRPPLLREVEEYSAFDKQRLLVKPGCTGLWQISGRSSTTFKEMVDLDIKYIKKRNTVLDIKIIFKTFKSIIISNDAY